MLVNYWLILQHCKCLFSFRIFIWCHGRRIRGPGQFRSKKNNKLHSKMGGSVGRKRTDIVFRYPQLLGNVKFAWGKSPQYLLPKVRKNLCLTNDFPIQFANGSMFVNLRSKIFIPKNENELPPQIGMRNQIKMTADTMQEIRNLHVSDPLTYTITELAVQCFDGFH